MKQSNLMNLYREMIVEYGESPHNFGTVKSPTVTTELHNPTCGDVINLQLKVNNQKIIEVKFDGDGCIISQASASILTDLVKGKSLEEAKHLRDIFSKMITDPNFEETSELEDAEVLRGVRQFPQRIKCATLAWNALDKSILKLEESNG
jgi:nitrogen fixation protein NifU and related proteins